MTAPLKIKTSEALPLRTHYEQVARDTLRVIWQRKPLITAIMGAALILASIALVLIGPHYTAEAIIQLNFVREESATGMKIQPVAAVDAFALVDSAARGIRSRATASAVVAQLGLDKDPDFAREPTLWRVLSGARAVLGLRGAAPTPHDLAVNHLMRTVKVSNDPRSYLISVAVTTGDPERAAALANAVGFEYLRGQLLQQVTEATAAAERELGELSSVYGVLHPTYLAGRGKLEGLQLRLSGLRQESPREDVVKQVMGQSFLAAERDLLPSGPNLLLVLGLTLGAALALGIWLAFLLPPDKQLRADGYAIVRQALRRLMPNWTTPLGKSS
jgi:uncharacterized protein involved in exopolysaccharide biosynthesis